MAVTIRGSAAGSANPTSSGTATIPAGTVAGEPCYVFVTSRDSTGAGTLTVTDNDTGGNTWTKISNTADHKATIWCKRATSGTASKTVTVSNAVGSLSFVVVVFSGASHTGDAHADIAIETNASGDETHAGFTPSVADAFVWLSVHNTGNDNAVTSQATATNPGTLNTLSIAHLSTGGNDCATAVAGKAQSGAAAATGNFTWAQTDGATYSIVGIIKPGAAPGAPTIGTETNVVSTDFIANWTAPASGDSPVGYKLDVATDSGFSSLVSGYNDLDVGNVTAYGVIGLSPSTSYWYRVSSYNSIGASSESGSEAVTTSASSYTYVLRDEFTTTAGAPLTSPRTAEPGPGTLTLVQTDGQFSISNGKLNYPAQATAAWGDQGFYGQVSGAGIARGEGRALMATITAPLAGKLVQITWDDGATVPSGTATGVYEFLFDDGNLGMRIETSEPTSRGMDPAPLAGTYQVALVLHSTGGATWLYRRLGGHVWRRVFYHKRNTTTPIWPTFSNLSQAGTLDNFQVVDLPSPFDTEFGSATTNLAGARSVSDSFTQEADALLSYTLTTRPSAGNMDLRFRVQDSSNYWINRITSAGDFGLYEVVGGGAAVSRSNTTGVAATGNPITLRVFGTTVQGITDRTHRWEYSTATNFQTATAGLLADLGTGGAVSDIVAWPRTLSGSALDTLNGVSSVSVSVDISTFSQSQTLSAVTTLVSVDVAIATHSQSQTLSTLTESGTASTALSTHSQSQTLSALTEQAGAGVNATTHSQGQTLGSVTEQAAASIGITTHSQSQSLNSLTEQAAANTTLATHSQSQTFGPVSASAGSPGDVTIATHSQAQTLSPVTESGSAGVSVTTHSQSQTLSSLTESATASVSVATHSQGQTLGTVTASGGAARALTTHTQVQTLGSVTESGGAGASLTTFSQGQTLSPVTEQAAANVTLAVHSQSQTFGPLTASGVGVGTATISTHSQPQTLGSLTGQAGAGSSILTHSQPQTLNPVGSSGTADYLLTSLNQPQAFGTVAPGADSSTALSSHTQPQAFGPVTAVGSASGFADIATHSQPQALGVLVLTGGAAWVLTTFVQPQTMNGVSFYVQPGNVNVGSASLATANVGRASIVGVNTGATAIKWEDTEDA